MFSTQGCSASTVDFVPEPEVDEEHTPNSEQYDAVEAYLRACRAGAKILKRTYALIDEAPNGEERVWIVCEGVRAIRRVF